MHSNSYTEVFALASNPNLLDLLQGEHIRSPVVELGGARGGVRGDGLRLLDHSPILQVGGDAGGAAMPGGGLCRERQVRNGPITRQTRGTVHACTLPPGIVCRGSQRL